MKKILFLFLFLYSFSNALTITEIAGEQYSITFSSSTGGTWNTTTPTTPHCSSWNTTGSLIYQRMCYSGGQTYAYNVNAGRYGYAGTVFTTTATLKLKATPNEPNTCSETSVVGGNSLFICNPQNGDYLERPIIPNGTWDNNGNLNCNSGYSATGIALGIPACMPNPDNGTWDDNDDLVCNSGYVADVNNTCTLAPENTNDGCPTGYHSYTDVISGEKGCIPDYIPPTPDDGTGGTTGGDSGTGGTTGGDSGTGGTTGGDSGTGGTTGGDSGTGGTTGGNSGTGGANSNSGNGTDLGGVISAINKNTTENTSILTKIFDAFNSNDSSLTSDVSTNYSNTGNDFVNFYNDMKSSYNNFNTQFDTAKGIFEGGFNFTPIYAINNPNLKECLTIKPFNNREIVFDFITPLNYIKPIFTLIIQLFMLVEVVRMCFKIINYARGLF